MTAALARAVCLAALAAACDIPPGLPAEAGGAGAPPATIPPAPKAHSVQLHVHGSFSEGLGSMSSHTHEAADVGADVIWWSDHDWRIASYRHISHFGFESWLEPIDAGEPWRAWKGLESADDKGFRFPDRPGSKAELTRDVARQGTGSLRVSSRSETRVFRTFLGRFESTRSRHNRSLASRVTIDLAIFPESAGPDARPLVEVVLSEHFLSNDAEPATLRLRYVLDNAQTTPSREGATYRIPLVYRPGRWNAYTLPVTRHAVEGFPELPGEDNSLRALDLGVESRRGARGSACFDALVIRQEFTGARSYARQDEMLADLAERQPRVRQLRGVELSYFSPHLNEFSLAPELPDYDALVAASGQLGDDGTIKDLMTLRRFVARQRVEAAHARGGLVSYNHPFGAQMAGLDGNRSADALLRSLIRSRAFGADLLEVGYRDRGGRSLTDHLKLWDDLTRAGVDLVGIGVSDSHGGRPGRWRGTPNNFLSWVIAPGPDAPSLLGGLAAGRVFFGDIERFDGVIDLATDDGARMGQIVVSDRSEHEVRIRVWGASTGDRVHVVEASGTTARYETRGTYFERRHGVRIPPGKDGFVRVELRDGAGAERAFSNPIVFRRARPPATLRPERIFVAAPGRHTRTPARSTAAAEAGSAEP